MALTAIILAGGLGTRLKKAVPNYPKPMAPINKRPFLEYLLDYWIEQGVTNFILSVGYRSKIIINHFSNEYKGVSIQYSIEDTPLGTGGALLKASKYISGSFLLLNGDTFFEVDLTKITNFHFENKSDFTFSLFSMAKSNRYMRIELNSKKQIISFNTVQSKNINFANGGVYLINSSLLQKIELNKTDTNLSLENQLIPYLSECGCKFFGFESNGKFIDIGIPDDYYRAHQILID